MSGKLTRIRIGRGTGILYEMERVVLDWSDRNTPAGYTGRIQRGGNGDIQRVFVDNKLVPPCWQQRIGRLSGVEILPCVAGLIGTVFRAIGIVIGALDPDKHVAVGRHRALEGLRGYACRLELIEFELYAVLHQVSEIINSCRARYSIVCQGAAVVQRKAAKLLRVAVLTGAGEKRQLHLGQVFQHLFVVDILFRAGGAHIRRQRKARVLQGIRRGSVQLTPVRKQRRQLLCADNADAHRGVLLRNRRIRFAYRRFRQIAGEDQGIIGICPQADRRTLRNAIHQRQLRERDRHLAGGRIHSALERAGRRRRIIFSIDGIGFVIVTGRADRQRRVMRTVQKQTHSTPLASVRGVHMDRPDQGLIV